MQKWEYLFIKNEQTRYYDNERYPQGYVKGGDLSRTYSENGQEFDGANLEVWEVASRKGEEGWELVSAAQGYYWELILKRPKS